MSIMRKMLSRTYIKKTGIGEDARVFSAITFMEMLQRVSPASNLRKKKKKQHTFIFHGVGAEQEQPWKRKSFKRHQVRPKGRNMAMEGHRKESSDSDTSGWDAENQEVFFFFFFTKSYLTFCLTIWIEKETTTKDTKIVELKQTALLTT